MGSTSQNYNGYHFTTIFEIDVDYTDDKVMVCAT